jgi:hypothetical protein
MTGEDVVYETGYPVGEFFGSLEPGDYSFSISAFGGWGGSAYATFTVTPSTNSVEIGIAATNTDPFVLMNLEVY